MNRPLCLLMAAVVLAASAAPPTAAAAPADRVADLVGNWTCRNPFGALSTVVYRARNGAVTADETADGSSAAHDVFTPDRAGGWGVERTSARGRFTGRAAAWTTDPWIITEAGTGRQITYARIDDRTVQRTLAAVSGRPYTGEVCSRGDAPPDASLCPLHDTPPSVVSAAQPDVPAVAQMNRVNGMVQVLVSLDADGRVVRAAIRQSPSVALNAASLDAARRTTYRPALRDCKPVPSEYIFSVDFSG